MLDRRRLPWNGLTLSLLSATIVVFNVLLQVNSEFLGMKCVFKHQDLQMFGFLIKLKITMLIFHPFEFVSHGFSKEIQEDENLNKIS